MSFVNERPVKAIRKARRCDACNAMVNVGDPAVQWAGVSDGQFSAALYHTDCRAAEVELNKLHETGWHPDDWMGLDCDMERDDHPWLLASYPHVAARMAITAETVAEDAREEAEARAARLARCQPTPSPNMAGFAEPGEGR